MNGSDAQPQPPANRDSAALGSKRSERENELLWPEITGIRPYEHNPRRTENSAYERIKASIQADGLEQPLVVTQQPDESDYRAAAGGNTRLQILQELHAETGDERFLRVPCLYRPWTDEADVLIAHLKENDLRGDLSFLDKVRAVVEFKELIAAETDRSISVSLDDEVAMPGNGTMCDESRETCAPPGEPESTDRQARSLSPPAGDQPECGHENKRNQAEDAAPSLEEPLLPEDDEPSCPTVGVSAPEAEGESNAAAGLSMPTDLKSLRARSWTLVRRFAQRHGIGELIAPLGNAGLGFLLSDVPDPALTEVLDEDSLAQVSAVWWVLAACSEMTVAPSIVCFRPWRMAPPLDRHC